MVLYFHYVVEDCGITFISFPSMNRKKKSNKKNQFAIKKLVFFR